MELIELKEYLLAWLAYLAGCVVLLAIGWGWTRNLRYRTLKYMLRLGVSAALLTPVAHENAPLLKVPAIAVGLFGWLTGDAAAAESALEVLAAVVLAALLLAAGLARLEKPSSGKAKTMEEAVTEARQKNDKSRGQQRIEPTMNEASSGEIDAAKGRQGDPAA